MSDNLKVDLINGAYSQMRISGLTVNPTSEDNTLALKRLENMAAEFAARNICTGYFFEDEPDVNTPHNLDRKFWYSFECLLAVRLLSDFGKGSSDKADPVLFNNANAQMSFLYSNTAPKNITQYPSRQPVGSGNSRFSRYRKFYPQIIQSPESCDTIKMYVGNIDDFVEHFDAYLKDGEDIASYTLEADTGLTVVSESLSSPDVLYTIQAAGNISSATAVFQVKIIATTSDSRVETRIINFELVTAPEIA